MTEDASPEKTMPFLDHLEELRRVLIFVGIVVAVGAAGAWYWSGDVLDWLIQNTSGDAIFMRPQGAFLARIKVAIVLGLMATLPIVFFKIWSFVGPGLLETEKKFVLPGVIFSLLLFYLGVAFSYFVLTPLMVDVLLGFGNLHLRAQTEITFLLDLVFTMGMASGLVFQMPLVLAFLTIINVITPSFLKQYWRHAIVLIFISAALLTPADPVSQVLLAVPLILLYGISLVVCTVIYKGKRNPKPKGDPNAVSH